MLNDPPVKLPENTTVPKFPVAPVLAGNVTVVWAEAPAPIVPRLRGSGVPETPTIVAAFRVTFCAAPPLFAMVSVSTRFRDESRVIVLVRIRLGVVEAPGFTVRFTVFVAALYFVWSAGVKVAVKN